MHARASAAALAAAGTILAVALRTPARPADAAAPPSPWQSHACADCVVSVAAASDAVWAGTFGAGIVRHDARDGSWRRYGRADGVDGDTVRELAVGPDGDVWAVVLVGIGLNGRGASVAHFDGARWTSYGAADAAWLANLHLGTQIAAGPRGTAMFALSVPGAGGTGSVGHVARFDGTAWHFDGPAEGMDGRADATAFGPDGRAYALIGRLVRRFEAGRWAALPDDGRPRPALEDDDPSSFNPYPLSMAVGADGTVFVAHATGVERYREAGWPDGGHWRHDALAVAADERRFVQADTGGAAAWLVAATYDHSTSVYRFDGQRWQRQPVPALRAAEADFVTVLPRGAVGPDGRVWLGYLTDGLAVWDGARIERRLTGDGPPKYMTNAVAIGLDGRAWVGSFALWNGDEILSVFDGKRWLRHGSRTGAPTAPSIIGVAIGAIDVGAGGDVWIGFEDGAARYDGRRWSRWHAADGLPPGRVVDLAADDRGGAWAATWAGIGYFDGAWWRRIPAADAALPGQVNGVAVDHRPAADIVWFGGEGAVARYDGARWQAYGAAEGVPNVSMLDVAVDAQGDAWFSTNTAGVVKCGAARCETTTGTNGILDGARGWGIALDAAGRPWVAQTVEGDPARDGLVHFDGRDWVRYSTADGLLDNIAFDVAVDGDGRVWTATIAGISVFTPPDAPPAPVVATPPAPTAMPPDDAPKVCPQLDGRAPASAITSALASPAALDGWLAPANPNRPVGPFNARRTWLTLRQPGAPYDPVANGLVWRDGCP